MKYKRFTSRYTYINSVLFLLCRGVIHAVISSSMSVPLSFKMISGCFFPIFALCMTLISAESTTHMSVPYLSDDYINHINSIQNSWTVSLWFVLFFYHRQSKGSIFLPAVSRCDGKITSWTHFCQTELCTLRHGP